MTPLFPNLDNCIGIYQISNEKQGNQGNQKQTSPSGNNVEYSKYLVIKIESYQSNTNNTSKNNNNNNSSNISTFSSSTIKKKFQTQVSVPDNSSFHLNSSKQNSSIASSRTLLKASNSSSTSSFIQLANQSDGALLLNQNLQKTLKQADNVILIFLKKF